jgi:hypothetical protein
MVHRINRQARIHHDKATGLLAGLAGLGISKGRGVGEDGVTPVAG